MANKNGDFLKKLLVTFKVEAEEHLKVISSGLFELEKTQTIEKQMEIIETIFREAHSLKGAARAVNATDIEMICQSLESTFASLKRREKALSVELIDTLQQSLDTLSAHLSSLTGEQAAVRKTHTKVRDYTFQPEIPEASRLLREEPLKEERKSSASTETSPLPSMVRISTTKLDSLLYQAEEFLSTKLSTKQRSTELRELNGEFVAWKKEWAKVHSDVRSMQQSNLRNGVDATRPDGHERQNSEVANVLKFLEWSSDHVKSLEGKLAAIARTTEQDHRATSKMVDDLLDDMKKVLMLPFLSLLELFPKLVRDLSRDRGKNVELEIVGGDIEIDRRILEEMKDPLIHLVRNCIDHGIEAPPVREKKKKSPRGKVALAIAQRDGSKVEILISDDGSGIDAAKVKGAALKLGIVGAEEAEKMNEQETLSLIFRSGVSTSPIITDISGRGLGLAIVLEKVESLGGTVSLETRSDLGSTFRIIVPLTMATFRGVLVRLNEHLFVLPTMNVERVLTVKHEEIKTVENRETIQLNGQAASLVRLSDVMKLPRNGAANNADDSVQVVVLTGKEKRIAFLVDEVLQEQEVLVKSLGKQLSRVRNIAGATVLGNGKVVPILNVPDLLMSAVSTTAPSAKAVPSEEPSAERKSILVVEDSITARTLLKNILESAGYHVKTAVDGIDAFTILRTEGFDIVVSDVDMPRMNGLDLTAKIRREKKYAELPVVLVTALESREDRERGIDVGANAYIVKSSFDQSNLLEVIRRLT